MKPTFTIALSGLACALSSPAASQTPPTDFSVISPASARLTLVKDGGEVVVEIDTVDEAVALLADRRATALWPAILDWAGPDLVRLRDATLADARAAMAKGRTKRADSAAASIVSKRLRPAFLLADALRDAGRFDEATALMLRARGSAPGKGRVGQFNWAAATIWLSGSRYLDGDVTGALAVLDGGLARMDDERAAMNLTANRVAYLLEADRPAEALAALDRLEAAFEAPGGSFLSGNVRIRGSDRHFAWIRACALTRLGRADEARAAAEPLRTSEEPREGRFVIDPTIILRRELARCTGDVDASARAYADALRDGALGDEALVELQPALRQFPYDPDFMDRVRRHPTLAPLLAERMAVLPDRLMPALNSWRDGSKTTD